MIITFGKLIGLVAVGYLLFHDRRVRERLLPLFTGFIVKFLIPLYMITRYGSSWDEALQYGFYWMPIFFFLGGFTILFQYLLIRNLFRLTPWFNRVQGPNRNDFILLFSIHNAGYIPLPILAKLVPDAVLVYMFSYIFAFHLIFWSFAISIIKTAPGERPTPRVKLNAPLVSIITGIVLAASGIYEQIPFAVTAPLEQYSRLAMDGILIVLGGILAGVPHESLRTHREFIPFLTIRQTLYPALVLLFCIAARLLLDGPALFPTGAISMDQTWRWMQLVLVIQAAVPPATNIMIAVQQFGSDEQLRYTGSGIILSYLGAAITVPLFVLLALMI